MVSRQISSSAISLSEDAEVSAAASICYQLGQHDGEVCINRMWIDSFVSSGNGRGGTIDARNSCAFGDHKRCCVLSG